MKNTYALRQMISAFAFLLFFYAGKSQCTADFSFEQDICFPKTVFFSAASPLAQSFNWDFGNGTYSNSPLNTAVIYEGPGTYSVTLTVNYVDGCIATQTKPVTVYLQQDNGLVTTRDSSICMGDSIFLQTSGLPGNFCWYSADGSINTNSPDIYVSPRIPSTYYFISQQQGNQVINSDFSAGNTGFTNNYNYCNYALCLHENDYAVGTDPYFYHNDFRGFDHTTGNGNLLIVNGATAPDIPVWSQQLTVTPNTDYSFSIWLCTLAGEYAPSELQLLVNGLPVGATVTAPSSLYTWLQHSAIWNSGTAGTAIISVAAKSNWSIGNDFGLDDIYFGTPEATFRTDSVTIDVKPMPQLQVGTGTVEVCGGKPVQLIAVTNAADIRWSPAAQLNDPTLAAPIVNDIFSTTTFYIQAQTGNCIQKDSIAVKVHDKPAIAIEPVKAVCRGTAAILMGEVAHANSYSWKPSTGLSGPAALKTTATPDSTTIYRLVATNEYCADSMAVQVTVHQLPDISVHKSNDIGCGHSAAKLEASGASEYTWFPVGSVQDSLAGGQIIIRPDHTTVYMVEGTDENRCLGKNSIIVNVYNMWKVYVPNAFTPNHDGINDVFKPVFKSLPSHYECRIFNRLGEMVFSSTDPARGWDGRYKSMPASTGVYSYVIKMENECGPELEKGFVILIQ